MAGTAIRTTRMCHPERSRRVKKQNQQHCHPERSRRATNKYILILFALVSYLSVSAKNITINGQVQNIPNSTAVKIYLSIHKGVETEPVDSIVADAKGNFKFVLNEPKQGIYILFSDKKKPAKLIVGNEPAITVSVDYATFKEGTIRVISSKENDAYAVLSNFYKQHNNEVDSIGAVLDELSRFDSHYQKKSTEIKAAYTAANLRYNNSVKLMPELFPGTFTADVLYPLYLVADRSEFAFGKDFDTDEAFQHKHFFEHINFSDPRILSCASLELRYFTYLDSYVEHTEKGFKEGVDIIMSQALKNNEVRDFTINYLLSIFTKNGPSQLVEYVHTNYSSGCEIALSPETEKLISKMKPISIGSPAPELSINDINFTPASLKNTLKGKVGMVYFWSSTCNHCMEYTPKIFEAYQKYKNKGFEVYAVSLDSDYASWLKAIQDMKLEWVNVSDLTGSKSVAIQTYVVERTPTIFLVDRAGNITDKNFSPDELEVKLKKYLP